MNKKIVYITTNESWSGSEELWTRSAKEFCKQGYSIAFASKYNHKELSQLNGTHYNFSKRFFKSVLKRTIEKLINVEFKSHDIISDLLKKENPKLVVLSQGNNIDRDGVMACCYNAGIPYFTLTQLVTEFFFLEINNINLFTYQRGYQNAVKNFFVSQNNLSLNNLMFSMELSNAEVVNNPCKIDTDKLPAYPEINGVYKIGLVGRIECFHKGYDLLLQLANMEKWKVREVHFNIFGDGPHKELLKATISRLRLNHVTIRGHENDVNKIWSENHILFMPSRMEGQSLSLIEALYCQRAAIVTNVGGAAELIEDNFNGFIADAATVNSLDNALERAWDKRDSWKELGISAAKILKERYKENAVKGFNQKVLKSLSEFKYPDTNI